MIRLDMGEPPMSGTARQDWASVCIRLLRAFGDAVDDQPHVPLVEATLTFNKVTVPVYADDDVSRVSLRLSAAKPNPRKTHPATMIGRRGRG